MKAHGRHVTACVALALALSGCSQSPVSPLAETTPLRGEASDAEFTLVITSPEGFWPAGEAINVQAELSYRGPLQEMAVAGSGSGVVGFSVDEVGGNRKMEAAWDDVCRHYAIRLGQPTTTPFRKSGGWTAEDPNAGFYQQFFSDPLFRLPPGSWRITAQASFRTGPDCGGGRLVDMHASLLITVQ
jgi:hypothetical protein